VRPVVWWPPADPSPAEQAVIKAVRRAKLFVFLRQHRHELRAAMPFEAGKTVRFPKNTCAACPLQARCTTSSNGRSVAIYPDEALPAELRQRQKTPEGRAEGRERVAVEHALAHVGHWQGRRARYLGTRKNLFDLRRVAVVRNLHVIARRPATDSYQIAA
jgi:hypothetical protein